MELNISEIVTAKLAQMERDGIVQKTIEESLEKGVLDAITSELNSYAFKHAISQQVSQCIGEVAANCGFSAYNGFIAERVKAIIQDMYTTDISQKVQSALNDVMLKKHENVKLSEIFQAYRDWVIQHTDIEDKYERREFTRQLNEDERGNFTHYTCAFADHPLDDTYGSDDQGDIVLRLCAYNKENKTVISRVYLDGRNISQSLRIGSLADFEAFVVNLFYSKTEIILDVEDVEEYSHFDIDC